nr:MAG TPA: hypothetical protein [Caudoviricetes sp.]
MPACFAKMREIEPDAIMAAVDNYIADHEELCDDAAFRVTGVPAWDDDAGCWQVPAEDDKCTYYFATVADGYGDWDIRLGYGGSNG